MRESSNGRWIIITGSSSTTEKNYRQFDISLFAALMKIVLPMSQSAVNFRLSRNLSVAAGMLSVNFKANNEVGRVQTFMKKIYLPKHAAFVAPSGCLRAMTLHRRAQSTAPWIHFRSEQAMDDWWICARNAGHCSGRHRSIWMEYKVTLTNSKNFTSKSHLGW